ncbi:glycolate oxidase subunit GlcE [Chromatiales bacterium (ex Bugula neritina AB1)]|nr:glycolate oxidase subunit GlcE [Chromatiales bacterium (ex Bugula neritina AB1)]
MTNSSDNNQDIGEQLQQQIAEAYSRRQPLTICGGGSKSFLGLRSNSHEINTTQHSGVVSYEPTELVITARCGTPLSTIREVLAAHHQMLPFEPPSYGESATLGGTMACALSGPARPYSGAARDYALGCRMINGQAQTLRFGGEVMKNVAGYDVTRLMTGAMGTLGLLLDFSLKVLPLAEHEITLAFDTTVDDALQKMQALAGQSQPVTASAFYNGTLYIRLAGAHSAVMASANRLPGEVLPNTTGATAGFWEDLREHRLDFFKPAAAPLWRISVPPLTPPLDLSGECFYDWAGMQRWLFSEDSAGTIRQKAASAGGHAQLFRASDELKAQTSVTHPPGDQIMNLHRKIKNEFDPAGLFNRNRLYADL